jgi:hypothetical protein
VDAPGIPLDILVLVIIVMPVCVVVFFGLFAFRDMTPLAFHCLRCGRDFAQKPHLRFPVACPHCHARDWNAA